MKPSILVVMVLFLSAGIAEGQDCRSASEAEEQQLSFGRLPEGDHWGVSDRDRPLFFVIPGDAADRGHVAGTVCDPEGRPMPRLAVRLVRYEGRRPEGVPDLQTRHLDDGTLQTLEQWGLETDASGALEKSELRPGKYALVADWVHVGVSSLIFDFQVLPGIGRLDPQD